MMTTLSKASLRNVRALGACHGRLARFSSELHVMERLLEDRLEVKHYGATLSILQGDEQRQALAEYERCWLLAWSKARALDARIYAELLG